jgi:hypothetical protein
VVKRLFSYSPLYDYLLMGLEELEKRGIDLDAVPEKIAA